jgi:hypothetical protein
MQYLEARNYRFELQSLALAAVLWIRICMFLGHPDPLGRGTDPDPNPSIINQK